ncbi:hypothetical protein COM48_19445 [Bacillus wiedmannii]|nr:hypothetical protein COM48_19445 [Bacillus wiedmannii]
MKNSNKYYISIHSPRPLLYILPDHFYTFSQTTFIHSHNPLPIYMSNPLQIHAECNIIAKLGIFFFSI